MADIPANVAITRPATPELAGFATTGPGSDAWSMAVGQFILNFGLLELMTYWFIARLGGEKAAWKASGTTLNERIQKIKHLAKSLPHPVRGRIYDAWTEVSRLAKTRNETAHNPLGYYWGDADKTQPPPFEGIVKVGKLKESDPKGPVEILTKDDLAKATTDSSAVANKLHDLLKEIGWSYDPTAKASTAPSPDSAT